MKSLPYITVGILTGALLFGSAALAEPAKAKLTEAEVLKLVQLSIDDQAVIDRLKAGGGVDFKVDDAATERLKKAGASDRVLNAVKGGDEVIAHAEHQSGAIVEITELKRTSDGYLHVSFRYRNPTGKVIKLYTGGSFGAWDSVTHVYCIEPGNMEKFGAARDKNNRFIGFSAGPEGKDMVAPAKGFSPTYWLKLNSPDPGVEAATFYFPEATPMEDVPLPQKK